ncbi:MAG: YIP1 family protein [Actinomycetota bacterium]|nr:YIP1 family protein [Actinomycetota bacterium]
MLDQMYKAARLDRSFYTQLIFDSYATGNAVLVVALVHGVRPLVRFPSLSSVLNVVLNGLIAWLLLALAVWLVGTKLLDGDARIQTTIRLTGFAHVPLLALLIPVVGLWIGLAWFAAAVFVAAQASLGVDQKGALVSAGSGLLVWLFLRPF